MRKMKDSGVAWLGEIPENWQVVPSKALFRLRKEKAAPGDRQLTASQQHGIIYQDDYMALTGNRVVTVEKDFSILKRVEKGDFVISMRSFQGGLEYSENAGSISSAYVMLIPDLEYVVPEFYKWLFKSPTYITALQCTSNLIRDGQALRYNNFVQVPLCIIPKDDQKKIAGTLGEKCQQIDDLISNVQAQIEKLKAYKQSLITEVVTKGLDPNVPMMDSGVEWIGKIPKHWNMIRFRFIAKITTGNQDTQNADPDGMYPFYVRSPIVEHCNNYTFEGKGILMAGDGAGAGRVFHLVNGKYAVHQRVYRFYDFKYMNPVLLKFYLENLFATVMDYGSAKTTVPSVRLPMIQDFPVCVPPEDEQLKMLEVLSEKTNKIDRFIAVKQTKIEKLEQYKRSLIYEYVTGKKEVS